jgi:predicted metal-dependent peptidase
MDSLDNHDSFGDASDQTGQDAMDIAKERLKQNLKDAAREANARSNGWGSVPADMRKQIMLACKSSINWRAVLRYFVKTSERADRRSTPRRINRRFPKIHPGKRVRRHAKIAISVDQSGSVDDGMLALFFAELNKLSELATFTIIPFDTRVDESLVYIWKKGEKRVWERVMCGGTDFDPPTKYVNDRDFDGHIVLTDMMAPKPVSSRCQRMWMTTEDCANHPYFTTSERVIAIKA